MKRVGRNDPCPCGSGNKYKRCCLGMPAADRTPSTSGLSHSPSNNLTLQQGAHQPIASPVIQASFTPSDPLRPLREAAEKSGFLPGDPDARKAAFVPATLGWELVPVIHRLKEFAMQAVGRDAYLQEKADVPFLRLVSRPSQSCRDEAGVEDLWLCLRKPIASFSGRTVIEEFLRTFVCIGEESRWFHALLKIISRGRFEIGKLHPCRQDGRVLVQNDLFDLWKSAPVAAQHCAPFFRSAGRDLESVRLCSVVRFDSIVGSPQTSPLQSAFIADFVSPTNNARLFSEAESLLFVCEWEGSKIAWGLQSSALVQVGTAQLLKLWIGETKLAERETMGCLQALLKPSTWRLLVSVNQQDAWGELGSKIYNELWAAGIRVTEKARAERISKIMLDEIQIDKKLCESVVLLNTEEREDFRGAVAALWAQADRHSGQGWLPSSAAILKALAPSVYAKKQAEARKEAAAKRKTVRPRGHWRFRRDDIKVAELSDVQIIKTSDELQSHASREIRERGLGISPPRITFSRDDQSREVIFHLASNELILPSTYLCYVWNSLQSTVEWALAHVLAAEYLKSTDSEEKAYEMAWQRLSLEPQFRTMSRRMADVPHHWKEEDTKNDEEKKFLDRIDKLFSLAQSSNEAEAALAMERAQEMLMSRNVSRQRNGQAGQRDMVRLVLHLDKPKLENTVLSIAGILRDFYFVRVIYGWEWDVLSQKNLRCLYVLGRRENVLMAEHVFDFLTHKIESLWSWARSEKSLPGKAKLSYQMGLLKGFSDKLRAMVKARDAQATHQPLRKDEAALVALEGEDLETFVNEIFPQLKSLSTAGFKVHKEGYDLGKEDGADIVIHAPLKGSSETQNETRMLN